MSDSLSGGMVHLRFERGTLSLDGHVENLDGRPLGCPLLELPSRAPIDSARLRRHAKPMVSLSPGDLRERWMRQPRSSSCLGLRPYQQHALAAWNAGGQRGSSCCPPAQARDASPPPPSWRPACRRHPSARRASSPRPGWPTSEARLGERVGCVGDGKHIVARITVFTFESAYRYMDRLGDSFGLLVVDEAHHFGGGFRLEALASSRRDRPHGADGHRAGARSPRPRSRSTISSDRSCSR